MYAANYSPVPFLVGNITILVVLVIVDVILKGLALWRAARNNQSYWFVALLLVNSLGILPAIYLIFFAPKKHARKR